ncbi:MAG: murein biosynthesis integral membrane protein MurJ [Verrucomicrobiota bacterium]
MDNKNKLKDLGLVSGLTVLSRILGLLRDVVVYALLGTSVYSSAFVLAFTLPNLFRRLLGEGAMTSALVPILADALPDKNAPSSSPSPRILNQVTTRLSVWLIGIALVCSIAFWAIAKALPWGERWALGAHFASWLMPYMVFICLAAVFVAALNLKGYFGLSSLNSVWLNLSIVIGAVSANMLLNLSMHEQVTILCLAVLIGGVIQFGSVFWGLRRTGWRVKADWGNSDDLKSMWALLLPGLASSSILQINILLTRTLSNGIDDSSASVLYLASRLMEFPLGVFAIAISTVLFPDLARAASGKNSGSFAEICVQGMRWIAVITIPSVVGLWIYQVEIVDSLFRFGAFDENSVTLTAPVVGLYALSIPAYAWISFATRALHAQKKMQETLRVSLITLGVNAFFCLVGMIWGGILGLTLGNVLAAWVQLICLLLLLRLSKVTAAFKRSQLLLEFLKISAAAALMGASCLGVASLVSSLVPAGKAQSMITISVGIPVAVVLYFSSLLWFRQRDAVNGWAHFRVKLGTLGQK